MKKLLVSIALTASFVGSAYAADLPMKAAPMMPAVAPVANWTGCYVGAGGGYGMWDQEVTTVVGATGARSDTLDIGGRGWFGTVQVGCDYQFADRWVIGAFGDWDWSGLRGTMTWPRGGTAAGGTISGEERQRWTWAAGARLGYQVLPGLLAYVSGGYTETQFDEINSLAFSFTGAPATVSLPAQRYKGWFLGTGYEYGINFLPGLFWKTEYRFADYRVENLPFTLVATGLPQGDSIDSRKFVQTIRSELVWRFNFGGPVVARY